MPREAPLSDDLGRFPRLADNAAPAAICCFFDFAGIQKHAKEKLKSKIRQFLIFLRVGIINRFWV